MEKILFDSHSHISDKAFGNIPLREIIESSGIKYCMDIGTSIEDSLVCLESSKKYDFCYATVGVHPENLKGLRDEDLYNCLELFNKEEKVVAIGEIGFDFHYEDSFSYEVQKEWFKKQAIWAIENHAPICIHSRDADEKTLNLLKEIGAFSKERLKYFDGEARVLMHCFSGSLELAKEYISLGAVVSLGGVLTFKNARRAVEVALGIPIEKILIETDSPYMAPEPLRGTVNNPSNVSYVARKLAEIKDISYEEACLKTLENAKRFYNIE